jgi:hypothetical protein
MSKVHKIHNVDKIPFIYKRGIIFAQKESSKVEIDDLCILNEVNEDDDDIFPFAIVQDVNSNDNIIYFKDGRESSINDIIVVYIHTVTNVTHIVPDDWFMNKNCDIFNVNECIINDDKFMYQGQEYTKDEVVKIVRSTSIKSLPNPKATDIILCKIKFTRENNDGEILESHQITGIKSQLFDDLKNQSHFVRTISSIS